MAGRLIDGVRYIGLMNDNLFKSKSLEDNVYFTLRDIFWNGDTQDCMTANYFNGLLTNNICFEERDERFQYANILYDYNWDYTKKLYNWLCLFKKNSMFDFDEPMEDDEIDMAKYMKYDDWWDQLQELMKKLEEQLEKHKKWEAEDIGRDCDRQAELEDDKYFCEYDYEHCDNKENH
jgi:hypothetical protein